MLRGSHHCCRPLAFLTPPFCQEAKALQKRVVMSNMEGSRTCLAADKRTVETHVDAPIATITMPATGLAIPYRVSISHGFDECWRKLPEINGCQSQHRAT